MIFKQLAEVQDGRKIQTRRIVNVGDMAETGTRVGMVAYTRRFDVTQRCIRIDIALNKAGRRRFYVGQRLPIVPKRGEKALRDQDGSIQRVVIRHLECQRLHDITEEQAILEGVASVAEYKTLWESINGKTPGARWDDNRLVWVLTFTRV